MRVLDVLCKQFKNVIDIFFLFVNTDGLLRWTI